VKYQTKQSVGLCVLWVLVVAAAAMAETGPTGGFVYTLTNPSGPNSIAAYRQDRTSGKLTYFASYLTGGLGAATADVIGTEQNAIVTQGNRLYAVNPGSNDISIFAIQANGELLLLHAPFPAQGMAPVSLAIHGDLLYVANLGDSATPPSYVGFRVDGQGISPLENSAISLNIGDHPSDVRFDRAGRLLVGSRAIAGVLDVFRVAVDGRLIRTAELSAQPGVLGLSFNPVDDNQIFGGLTFLPGAAAYSVSTQGSVSSVNSVMDAAAIDTCWVAVEKTGKQAWFSAPASSSITLFSIDANGALARVSGHSTSAFGDSTTDMVFSSSEQFIYVLKPLSNRIEALRRTGLDSDAGLADVEAVEIPGSSFSATGIVFVGLGQEEER